MPCSTVKPWKKPFKLFSSSCTSYVTPAPWGPPQVIWDLVCTTGPLSSASSTPLSSFLITSTTALWKYCAGRKSCGWKILASVGLPRSQCLAEPRSTAPLGIKLLSSPSGTSFSTLYCWGMRQRLIHVRSISSACSFSPVASKSVSLCSYFGPSARYRRSHMSRPSPTSLEVKTSPCSAALKRFRSAACSSRSWPSRDRGSTEAMVQVSPRSNSPCSCPLCQPQYPTSSKKSSLSTSPAATSSLALSSSMA
mmetsp:Transcript_15464/g.36563  ORF Transcript_15464/g.36563 Transcript_15464/m.36563 type:complete len:251 (-) Transcript_15464:603-1355(-)